MKKIWVSMLGIAIIFIGILLGIFIYNNNANSNKQGSIVKNEINIVSEKVTDECTDEYQNNGEEIETDSQEEKISPNCLVVLKKYYEECKHTIKEYVDIPLDLVNGTEEDLKNEYPYW